jgi:HSP20 family protein
MPSARRQASDTDSVVSIRADYIRRSQRLRREGDTPAGARFVSLGSVLESVRPAPILQPRAPDGAETIAHRRQAAMSNIVPRSFFDGTIDDILRGFLVRPFAYEAQSAPQIRMDVTENENAYRVAAELPGVRKEDISVSVQADTVTIAVEVRREKEVKDGEQVLRSERYHGKVSRTVSFEHELDETAAEANYNDGVLQLVLPKKAAATRKRLTVN